jgi:hypothetical protein
MRLALTTWAAYDRGSHQRAQVAAEIVEAYLARPQTDEEYSWSDDATRDMIADEPW